MFGRSTANGKNRALRCGERDSCGQSAGSRSRGQRIIRSVVTIYRYFADRFDEIRN